MEILEFEIDAHNFGNVRTNLAETNHVISIEQKIVDGYNLVSPASF